MADRNQLRLLHASLSGRLERMEKLLPKAYLLTLVARNTELPNADILLTLDDLDEVVAAIRKLAVDPNAYIAGGPTEERRTPPAPGNRPHLREDGIPTRNDRTLMTAAELAITEAMLAVEETGASTELTDAVILLGEARNRVADHVEGQPAPPAEGATAMTSDKILLAVAEMEHVLTEEADVLRRLANTTDPVLANRTRKAKIVHQHLATVTAAARAYAQMQSSSQPTEETIP